MRGREKHGESQVKLELLQTILRSSVGSRGAGADHGQARRPPVEHESRVALRQSVRSGTSCARSPCLAAIFAAKKADSGHHEWRRGQTALATAVRTGVRVASD